MLSLSSIKGFMMLIVLLICIIKCDCTEDSYCGVVPYISLGYLTCRYCECCEKPWIKNDVEGLKNELIHALYGQHIAQAVIFKSLKGFLEDQNPQKALTMSFNGLTGSGKTFVSRLIAKHLYKNNVESKYVHLYVANKDFPHMDKVSQYQDILREEIFRYTKECSQSLFIFEEVEKMPAGTIDSLKPFLDYHENIEGVDFRKNIFIFISNSGSQGIVDKALEFWANGKDREDLCLEDIDNLVSNGSFNEKGGFQYSELLSSGLIDVFVPFLPLEKQHVKKCIEAELTRKGTSKSQEFIKKVSESLQYFPPATDLYSSYGCKHIPSKIRVFEL